MTTKVERTVELWAVHDGNAQFEPQAVECRSAKQAAAVLAGWAQWGIDGRVESSIGSPLDPPVDDEVTAEDGLSIDLADVETPAVEASVPEVTAPSMVDSSPLAVLGLPADAAVAATTKKKK